MIRIATQAEWNDLLDRLRKGVPTVLSAVVLTIAGLGAAGAFESDGSNEIRRETATRANAQVPLRPYSTLTIFVVSSESERQAVLAEDLADRLARESYGLDNSGLFTEAVVVPDGPGGQIFSQALNELVALWSSSGHALDIQDRRTY